MFKFVILSITLLLGPTAISPTQAQPFAHYSAESATELTESQKVQQLIEWVRHLEGATFIRNGEEYNCQQAADHLQSKWEKHKDQVKTAQEFIDALASKSGMSGEDYQIRFADGKTVTCGEALHQQLQQIEQS